MGSSDRCKCFGAATAKFQRAITAPPTTILSTQAESTTASNEEVSVITAAAPLTRNPTTTASVNVVESCRQ